jgi:hypothetical protein
MGSLANTTAPKFIVFFNCGFNFLYKFYDDEEIEMDSNLDQNFIVRDMQHHSASTS